MILKIGQKQVQQYNEVSISLHYDAVASTFGYDMYFDPANADHREYFRPCAYQDVTVDHEGQRVITGTALNIPFKSSPVKEMTKIGGSSKTGVLEDCEIPQEAYPLHMVGMTLEQIANKVCKPFGIKVIIDPAVSKE